GVADLLRWHVVLVGELVDGRWPALPGEARVDGQADVFKVHGGILAAALRCVRPPRLNPQPLDGGVNARAACRVSLVRGPRGEGTDARWSQSAKDHDAARRAAGHPRSSRRSSTSTVARCSGPSWPRPWTQ